jgi:hypothetical protein
MTAEATTENQGGRTLIDHNIVFRLENNIHHFGKPNRTIYVILAAIVSTSEVYPTVIK